MRGASSVSAIALAIAAAFAMATATPAQAATSQHYIQVGSRCQQDFQNNWQADAGLGSNDMWARCSGFQSAAATTEVNAFYYNLHGARWALEDADTCGWACGNADSVDLFYMSTHGGITSTSAIWAMWDAGSFAYTQNMRLGASSRQNMVLASFACDTHWINNSTWTRWYPVFAGGMVITVGGHNLLYQGNPQTGSDFCESHEQRRDDRPILARIDLVCRQPQCTGRHRDRAQFDRLLESPRRLLQHPVPDAGAARQRNRLHVLVHLELKERMQ